MIDPLVTGQVLFMAVFQTFWWTIFICQSSICKPFRDFWFRWTNRLELIALIKAEQHRNPLEDQGWAQRLLYGGGTIVFSLKWLMVEKVSDLVHCSFCMSFWQALWSTSFCIWYFDGSWWTLLLVTGVSGIASAIGGWQPDSHSQNQTPGTVGSALKALDT